MRPIDADALKDSFCLNCSTLKRYKRSVEECRANTDVYGNVCFKMRLIDKTPTLDYAPVRHGEWKETGDGIVCTDCGKEAPYISVDRAVYDYDWEENLRYSHTETDKEYFETDYCPNCGAKMDGGKTL